MIFMETPTNQQRANRWVKYMGGFFVFWSLAGLAAGIFTWPVGSGMLAAGLFQLLFAPERIDDERVKQLKLQSIMWGYGAGFALIVLHDFAAKYLVKTTQLSTLTAFEGFIIATVFALTLFHYWCWQDGRIPRE
jgi:hypothetical protein